MIVRGWHFSFDAGGDAALATLYYPGDGSRLEEARPTGQVPAAAGEPWPLVVMMPGINVAPDSYRWLAHRLVPTGVCVVTYAAIGSLGPAGQGITPGLDLDALSPANIGTRPVATALAAASRPPRPASQRPTARHRRASWTSTGWWWVAIPPGGLSHCTAAPPAGCRACGPCSPTGVTQWSRPALGHGEAAVVAIPAKVPVMLLAGTDDGVIAASRDRYRRDHVTQDDHRDDGGHGDHGPVRRTFEEAIGHRRGDSWLVELAGAGHFAACHPVDTTTGRAFLEPDPPADPAVRTLLGEPDRRLRGGQCGIGGQHRARGVGRPRPRGPLGSTVMGYPPRALANGSRKSRCEIGHRAPIFRPRFLGAVRDGSEDSPLAAER